MLNGSNTVSIHIASTPRTHCVVCSVVQSTLNISCFFLLQNIYVLYHAPQTQLTTILPYSDYGNIDTDEDYLSKLCCAIRATQFILFLNRLEH